MTEEKQRTANSTYKKLAVQWLNEALYFVSSSVVADSFHLRNRQLLVAAKRYGQAKNEIQQKEIYMKYILILLSSILLFSGEHLKKEVIVRNVKEKDTLIYSVSAKILGTTYHADYRSNSILYVINSKNDTITKQEEIGIAPNSLKFVDFNKDGTLDIRYGYNSNYYYEMILLFDSKTKKFRKIEDIDIPEYAYSKKIKNTDLYYSYSPNGCGKNNWTSYLFSIKDYKIIPKGLIEYRQCVDDKKGMYVFKINNEKKILIDKITLKEADKKQLEKQWNEHLEKIASP